MDAAVAGTVEPFDHIPYWICDEKQRRTGGQFVVGELESGQEKGVYFRGCLSFC
jgi:hypothetical protein